eukprot:757619-Pyramimonas_sp.AAC.1
MAGNAEQAAEGTGAEAGKQRDEPEKAEGGRARAGRGSQRGRHLHASGIVQARTDHWRHSEESRTRGNPALAITQRPRPARGSPPDEPQTVAEHWPEIGG